MLVALVPVVLLVVRVAVKGGLAPGAPQRILEQLLARLAVLLLAAELAVPFVPVLLLALLATVPHVDPSIPPAARAFVGFRQLRRAVGAHSQRDNRDHQELGLARDQLREDALLALGASRGFFPQCEP